MRCALLLAVALCACAPEPEPILPPDDPAATVERVVATVEEAVRQKGSGDVDAARDAWRRAHAQLDDELVPWLTETVGPREVVALEQSLGRVRAEMERRKGRPRPHGAAFAAQLRGLVEAAEPVVAKAEAPQP